MLEVIRQFYDKKSPLFVITITLLISSILAKGYDIKGSLKSSLSNFYLLVILICSLQVGLKTCGMEIFKRICTDCISSIHIILIFTFCILRGGLLAWAFLLLIRLTQVQITQINEIHEFFLQVFILVESVCWLVVGGLLISLKLENKTMTVLQEKEGYQQFSL